MVLLLLSTMPLVPPHSGLWQGNRGQEGQGSHSFFFKAPFTLVKDSLAVSMNPELIQGRGLWEWWT